VLAWQIITHSVRQVFGNLGPALRISALLMAIQFSVTTWFTSRMTELGLADPLNPPSEVPAGVGASSLAMLIVALVAGPWVAVAWHRYVLLEEEPGAALPAWNGARWAAYIWAMLRVGIVVVGAVFIGLVVLGTILTVLGVMTQSNAPKLTIIALIAGTYIGYRLCLVMPAAALGERMSIGASWKATAPGSKQIVFLAMILLGMSLSVPVIGVTISAASPAIGMLVQMVISWGLFLIGASVMTTLYGHFHQGRALVGGLK
jgi:hypothetical protein